MKLDGMKEFSEEMRNENAVLDWLKKPECTEFIQILQTVLNNKKDLALVDTEETYDKYLFRKGEISTLQNLINKIKFMREHK